MPTQEERQQEIDDLRIELRRAEASYEREVAVVRRAVVDEALTTLRPLADLFRETDVPNNQRGEAQHRGGRSNEGIQTMLGMLEQESRALKDFIGESGGEISPHPFPGLDGNWVDHVDAVYVDGLLSAAKRSDAEWAAEERPCHPIAGGAWLVMAPVRPGEGPAEAFLDPDRLVAETVMVPPLEEKVDAAAGRAMKYLGTERVETWLAIEDHGDWLWHRETPEGRWVQVPV